MKTDAPLVQYVGDFRFPNGNAGGHRVLNAGKCLRDAGYRVAFFGSEQSGRTDDLQASGGYVYQGFSYAPAGSPGKGVGTRLYRLVYGHLAGFSVMSRLRKAPRDGAVAVICYQGSTLLLAQLRRFCQKNQLALLADSVEWYDSRHVWGGRCGPLALDNALRMRWMQSRADGILAISSYLERYYAPRVGHVLRLPALVDIQEPQWRLAPRSEIDGIGTLRLAFAGIAGKKDFLANAIRGLNLAGEAAGAVTLVVVGPERQELRTALGTDADCLDQLGSRVVFTGRRSHREALQELAKADFSILLRPDSRFAQAGFPTKLVESLAMGVPVICNLTSDIGMYIHDGEEGIVVKDCSASAFAEGLKCALALRSEQKCTMRHHARLRAEKSFDYRNWVAPLGAFMNQVLDRFGGSQTLSVPH